MHIHSFEFYILKTCRLDAQICSNHNICMFATIWQFSRKQLLVVLLMAYVIYTKKNKKKKKHVIPATHKLWTNDRQWTIKECFASRTFTWFMNCPNGLSLQLRKFFLKCNSRVSWTLTDGKTVKSLNVFPLFQWHRFFLQFIAYEATHASYKATSACMNALPRFDRIQIKNPCSGGQDIAHSLTYFNISSTTLKSTAKVQQL